MHIKSEKKSDMVYLSVICLPHKNLPFYQGVSRLFISIVFAGKELIGDVKQHRALVNFSAA